MAWDTGPTSIVNKACRRYQLPYSTVQNWMKKVQLGQPIINTIGRPVSVDKTASESFVKALMDRRAAKDAVPFAETLTLLGQAVTDTKRRQGKRGLDAMSTIYVTTQKMLYKKYNVVAGKPQVLTDARMKACKCPRLTYIWGCVLMAYSATLYAENKWNADATTIIVSIKGTGSLVCTICDPKDESPVASSSIPDTLNLLVKWFGLNNAGDESGPLVLVFSIPTMAENTFFAAQVTSMSSTTTIGDSGSVYIAKTRGGCRSMWIHCYLHITVPTIRLSNTINMHTVSSKSH